MFNFWKRKRKEQIQDKIIFSAGEARNKVQECYKQNLDRIRKDVWKKVKEKSENGKSVYKRSFYPYVGSGWDLICEDGGGKDFIQIYEEIAKEFSEQGFKVKIDRHNEEDKEIMRVVLTIEWEGE